MNDPSTPKPFVGSPERQCVAHKKSGEQCRKAAMLGSSVCRSHGGAAPQVRRKAQQRILEASDKAAARLIGMLRDTSIPPAVQLAAARDLLDRANVIGTQQINVDVGLAKWEQIAREVIVNYVIPPKEIEMAVVKEEDEEPSVERRGLSPLRRPEREPETPAWYSPHPLARATGLLPLRPSRRES